MSNATDAMVNHLQFRREAESLIDALNHLIIRIPQKGNTSDECQRCLLTQKINELSSAINGTTIEDFM